MLSYGASTLSSRVPHTVTTSNNRLHHHTIITNAESNSVVVTRRALSMFAVATASVFNSSVRCLEAAAADSTSRFYQLPQSGGVKALDLRLGDGDSPVDGDQVAIHYYGRLAAKQGWRFDSTYDHKDETDGLTQPDAHIYLSGETDGLNWNSEPLPSLPFQALFGKLQQLATVAAGDVLLGKEKIQKVLLARLTKTVVMLLMSNEEDFWSVLENQVSKLQPQGLQQLILDMHFTVEIARYAGYPSRNVQQMASSIIARAIRTFSGGGLNQQSALPEDEWFVETAKAAINKLLMGGEDLSDTSEIDEDHIILHDDEGELHDDEDEIHDEAISDSDRSPSSLSTITTSESFASAESQMLDSLSDSADTDS